MKALTKKQNLTRIWGFVKPWITIAVIIIVLRTTGLMNGISVFTSSALFKTGLMDVNPEANKRTEAFDYDFTIKTLDGKKINVSDFKNKVVFLNMWATWCGPCRVEMPSIQALYDSVASEDVVFIMLSLDKDENNPKVVKYVSDKEFSFPVYQPSSALPKQLQVPSIPTTFVVGRDGLIKMKKVGTANYSTDKFKKFLRELQEPAE